MLQFFCRNFTKIADFSNRFFAKILRSQHCRSTKNYAHLVEREKCCQTHIFLQNFVSIQPRTSPPKNLQKTIANLANFASFANPNPGHKFRSGARTLAANGSQRICVRRAEHHGRHRPHAPDAGRVPEVVCLRGERERERESGRGFGCEGSCVR